MNYDFSIPDDILEAFSQDMKNKKPLIVLIFGPGSSGGDIYKKREEIRDKIRELGHIAYFGEEYCTPEKLVANGLNLEVAEYLLAKKCDYIICLMASPGSIGEVHDFAKYPEIATKMMICIDKQHSEGYSALGTLRIFQGYNGKIDWFEYPKDIIECHLKTRVVYQIESVAQRIQYEIATGRLS